MNSRTEIPTGSGKMRVMLRDRVLDRLANPYSPASLGARARRRRFDDLVARFPDFEDMHIVDLGGTTQSWLSAPVRPRRVTVVDIHDWALENPEPWMEVVQGDACDASTVSGTFDLVFSNSVIEHVGGPRCRRGFAQTVHVLSQHHWIQTPYRYFPLEPHFLVVGFQFLPLAARVALSKRWWLAPRRRRTDTDHVEFVSDHELLTVTEMRALFPQSELVRERSLGLVKSLVAVR